MGSSKIVGHIDLSQRMDEWAQVVFPRFSLRMFPRDVATIAAELGEYASLRVTVEPVNATGCARDEHRAAGELLPGACADCGVDGADVKNPASLRSAEEIAREMVVRIDWERRNRLVKLYDGNVYVHVELASDGEIDDLQALLARVIKRARADGAAGALAAQQPRDLASRIRALYSEYADRLLEERGDNATVLGAIMNRLKYAMHDARRGESMTTHIDSLRTAARCHLRSWSEIVLHVADDLERIVRECEAQR